MKKILSMLLSISLLFALTACEEDTTQSSSENNISGEVKSFTETVSYPRGTSETAIELYNQYRLFAEEENFELTEPILDGDYTDFYLNYQDTSSDLIFHLNEKSFKATINADKGSEMEKEIITRLLMGLDNISESNANKFATQIVTEEVIENISVPISIGEYIINIEYWVSESYTHSWLVFHHIDEIQKYIDTSIYSEIEKKALENPLNYNKKVKLQGVISNISTFESSYKCYVNIMVTDTDSKQYLCEYCYNDIPIILSERDRCTIFGEIDYTYDTLKEMEMCVQIEKISVD